MAGALIQIVGENLNSLIRREFGLLCGIKKEMEKLSSLLSTIQAVLKDAEGKQMKDKVLRNWLLKLNATTYEVDNILDNCTIERKTRSSTSWVSEEDTSSVENHLQNDIIKYLVPHSQLLSLMIPFKLDSSQVSVHMSLSYALSFCCIQRMENLKIKILFMGNSNCPELQRQYDKGNWEHWHDIAHIPKVVLHPKIQSDKTPFSSSSSLEMEISSFEIEMEMSSFEMHYT